MRGAGKLALAACIGVLGLLAGAGTASAASGPRLTVSQSELDAAFKCPIDPTNAAVTPVMFVTGTGASGDQGYLIGQDAFEAYGHPVCYVNFPDFTTADIQISVQYLVYGLRKEFALAHRKVAAIGISQGGLLPRFALTYWPDLRKKVGDVVAAAGTQHGTNIGLGGCTASSPCPPADWQQGKGSRLLRAINSQPDKTPGNVSYTTVRSLTDETVQPQGGKHPTSALDGASNILIQGVCPGRTTSHIGTAVDSVTFAAFVDAVAHAGKGRSGAARVSRFPADVCSHPFATGLNEAQTTLFLQAAGGIIGGNQSMVPTVPAEPLVRKVFKRVPDQKREHKKHKRR
jgi:triacylglycerol lipase